MSPGQHAGSRWALALVTLLALEQEPGGSLWGGRNNGGAGRPPQEKTMSPA